MSDRCRRALNHTTTAAAAVLLCAAFLLTLAAPASADHWSTRVDPDRRCPPRMIQRTLLVQWWAPDADSVVIGPKGWTRTYVICTWPNRRNR